MDIAVGIAPLSPRPAREGVAVLYGHRVLPALPPPGDPDRPHTVTCGALVSFLAAHLDKGWQAISLGDLAAGRYAPDRPAFALTFDDGYTDMAVHALPVCVRHNVPFAVFACSAFVNRSAAPVERLLAAALAGHPDREALYARYRPGLKGGAYASRLWRLNRIAHRLGLPVPMADMTCFMDGDMLAELGNHPLVTIGHHTATHPLLTRCAPWTAMRELRNPDGMRFHAYPFGGSSAFIRAAAARAGFTIAFTTENRFYRPGIDSAMAAPRIPFVMR